ncbi:AHPC/TSA ANTIOXIDANT ENZYME [Salix koriyanagi]|uniref:AHPC/TSA ANTIOXIDANT ENZYME n=1 Tax=Salix koriyanagi TaxID=2511006 RepID=A0A9Q0WU06_9ROSI|nr:AHPC/TSA ANTIOXIDANT ENZYME [Salix koriyanagi]
MASFSVEDFSGNGILKDLLQRCWKKEALEIRSYLHDRALLQYGEKLEASGKCLPELLSLSTEDLSSHFGMKRDHMARFMDRTSACEDPWLKSYAPLTARKMNGAVSRNNSNFKSYASVSSKKMQTSSGMNSDKSLEQSLADFKLKDGYIFKGIAAAGPAEPRACGCVQPPPVKGFWPRYWGGVVLFDRSMEFPFGGGQLLNDKIISGFIFNPELLQITSVQKLWELIKTSKEKVK